MNSFQTDLQRAIPKKVGENVGIQSVNVTANPKLPYNIEEQSSTATGIMAKLMAKFE